MTGKRLMLIFVARGDDSKALAASIRKHHKKRAVQLRSAAHFDGTAEPNVVDICIRDGNGSRIEAIKSAYDGKRVNFISSSQLKALAKGKDISKSKAPKSEPPKPKADAEAKSPAEPKAEQSSAATSAPDPASDGAVPTQAPGFGQAQPKAAK